MYQRAEQGVAFFDDCHGQSPFTGQVYVPDDWKVTSRADFVEATLSSACLRQSSVSNVHVAYLVKDVGIVQLIYAQKLPNPIQIAIVMKHIPKVSKFYVV